MKKGYTQAFFLSIFFMFCKEIEWVKKKKTTKISIRNRINNDIYD
jgi:hypothetical protein